MFGKNTLKKSISVLSVFVILFQLISFQSYAGAEPWSPYEKYIPDETPVVKRDLRATWISTVINLDWPSIEARDTENNAERIAKSKQELIAILDKTVEMNMNAVFFQVSPEGDALYKSDIVPWSRYLTGTYGKNPGFDPLDFAIKEAHKRNLEIHAWFNPYRVSMSTNDETKKYLNVEKSVYAEHPEWVKVSGGKFVVDPGIPAAREWVYKRVMEVVKNYDIDGVHFDDYFYTESYKGELKDEDIFSKYNNGQFSNIEDWRRNNTYILVKELSKRIRAEKPWVKFGISPGGVWGNIKDGHSDGSNTNTTYTNYERCFADTKKWVTEELIDYIAPQIYFTFANKAAPYGELASWWAKVCKGKNVHLYIGQALYKANADTDQYFNADGGVPEFSRQLKYNMTNPGIHGSIMFRYKFFEEPRQQQVSNAIKNDLWATKALVPVMEWKGGEAPETPVQGKINTVSSGVRITWNDNDANTAYYAVYRFNKGEKTDITSDKSAGNLIGTVRKNNDGIQRFTDTEVDTPDNVFYIVTALDRLHNESSGLVISVHQSDYFSDVGIEYSWALKEIDRLYEKGIVIGDDLGRFNPGYNTKRADFILMAVRALNFKGTFEENFDDVTESEYYYEAVGIAKALDIARGSGYVFNPKESITREDMMVIIKRALEALGIELEKAAEDDLKVYKDADSISDYAKEAVASLSKTGIVQGYEGGIEPKRPATRAEIAVVLHRVLNSFNLI